MMWRINNLASVSLLLGTTMVFIMGCSSDEDSMYSNELTVACDATNNTKPYCQFKNPEDIVFIPDSEHLIVSEMGEFMTNESGNLALFDLATKQKKAISIDWQLQGQTWGDTACNSPDIGAFSPHGIDVFQRNDQQLALLVVNHGKRESVEFFQILPNSDNDKSAGDWTLQWKGCAMPPGDPFINDVSGLNDNGFVVTHMWDQDTAYWMLVAKYIFGIDTGWVWRWHPENGFSILESTRGVAPNGIVVNKRDNSAFVNLYGDDKTIKVDIDSDQKLGEILVQQPDNITLDESGQLWIASHLHDPVNEECSSSITGPCMLPFEIVSADANSLNITSKIAQKDLPMGYATVALKNNNKLYLGSAIGDRILEIDLETNTQN